MSIQNLSRWKPGMTRSTKRLNAKCAAEMTRAMLAGKPTLHELVEHTGLSLMTVRAYVKAMHLIGCCHISGWRTDKRGAYTTPTWSLGAFPDAVKPLPLEEKARARAYRKQQKLKAQGIVVPTAALCGRKTGTSVQPGRYAEAA